MIMEETMVVLDKDVHAYGTRHIWQNEFKTQKILHTRHDY